MPSYLQVGPFWNVTASRTGAKQNILLSSPGPYTIPVPYNLTITGGEALDTLATWEWSSTVAPSLTSDKKVRHDCCCRSSLYNLLLSG